MDLGTGDLSARQKADENLRLSEERFRLLVEGVKDYAIFMLDPQGHVATWNAGGERLKGYTATEIVGRHFSLFYPQEALDRDWPNEELRRAEAEGRFEDEGWRLRKDGTEFWANVVITALHDENGVLQGFAKVTRDLSDRKEAEKKGRLLVAEETARRTAERWAQELAREREQLRVTLTSIGDGVIVTDAEGKITFLNPVAENLTRWTLGDAVGHPLETVFRVVHEETRERLESPAAKALRDRVVVALANHALLLARDGTEVYIEDSASPILDQDDALSGVILVFRDVTERKREEASQRTHTERFRLLWESAAVLLTTDSPEQMLQGVFAQIAPQLSLDCYFDHLIQENGEVLELSSCLGISAEGVAEATLLPVGRGIAGTAAATMKDAVYEHIQESTDDLTAFARKLGLRVCYCNALVVDGRLLGTLAFGSRRRDSFKPDELEFMRTIAHYSTVAYERLRLVDQLKEADKRKDHFLAILAHELRNPLAPIRNGLQILKHANIDNPSIQRTQAVMERQLTQMVRLIDDLLDMSRISRGKITLQKNRFDFVEAVSHAIETSRPVVENGQHELIVELPSEPLPIDADSARLAQVISNLLNNAAKFTSDGGRINLRVERRGDEVALSVRDNGVGIPAVMLGHIFDVFTQVDRSLERSQGGLGIGLSLVKGLVELHGGRVEVRSEGDRLGSEFLVYLPLAVSQEDTASTTAAPADAESSAGLRILVVDDNKDAALTLALLFGIMHHDVRLAHDGRQAIAVAEEYRPDLILMDIGMPVMNGYDACLAIRSQDWASGVTIVALTGWGQEDDKRKSREAGFDSHLVKPVEPTMLEKLVTDLAANPRRL